LIQGGQLYWAFPFSKSSLVWAMVLMHPHVSLFANVWIKKLFIEHIRKNLILKIDIPKTLLKSIIIFNILSEKFLETIFSN
jgi:hypothetical protein